MPESMTDGPWVGQTPFRIILKKGSLYFLFLTIHSDLCAKNNSVVASNISSSPLIAGYKERRSLDVPSSKHTCRITSAEWPGASHVP